MFRHLLLYFGVTVFFFFFFALATFESLLLKDTKSLIFQQLFKTFYCNVFWGGFFRIDKALNS